MTANSRHPDGLEAYRAKRDAQRTPEPFGKTPAARADGSRGIFVVQLHAAQKTHYDLRIELGGVLLSWAVPKGPSLDPAIKRMAVRTEDHPLEYADFEGLIPKGNYGAGAMIVWDRGTWAPFADAADDPRAAIERGVLHLELRGYKLRGHFMLVRSDEAARGNGKSNRKSRHEIGAQWLLFKKHDAHADPERVLSDESVLSGLTVDELARGPAREASIRADLERLGAPCQPVDTRSLSPMLCYVADAPFSDPAWLFELKYDGYRLLAHKRAGTVTLSYRSGGDATRLFPEVVRALAALPFESFTLDGEVVVLGDDGAPVFNRLQKRNNLSREADIERMALVHPATFMAFDLIAFADHDVRGLPLLSRKHLLERMMPRLGALRYSDHVVEHGEALYGAVLERGLEGVVAKRADSRYLGKRSESWLKIRVEHIDDFAIVGYTSPRGQRDGFGALHVAVCERDTWIYAGRVGTGFDQDELISLARALEQAPRWEPTFEPPSSPQRDDFWVEPALVCAVKYLDWPEGSHLRFPRFLHLRADKAPNECLFPAHLLARAGEPEDIPAAPEPAAPTAADHARAAVEPPARELSLGNLDKVYFPARDGHPAYTKGQVIDYYRAIAPHMLPFLRDRPLALTRFPDGIEGVSFFQKDMPEWMPSWIRTETLWSKHAQRELRYAICDDLDTLLFLVNMGTIALHVWSSRMSTLSRPDFAVIDLDPKGAPFAHVVTLARAIRALCRRIELECVIKTSGQDGLHVLIPLGAAYTFEQSRTLAELLSKVVEAEHPDIATTARRVDSRGGRVYLDYVQNAHGRLIAAPLSVRPRPGAPVSMPLRWREVDGKLDPRRHTIATAVRRMNRLRSHPLAGLLETPCDLPRALGLLAAIIESGQSFG